MVPLRFLRIFRGIAGFLSLLAVFTFAPVEPAAAQTTNLVSVTTNPVTGAITATDSQGNQYTFTLTGISPTGVSTFTVTFTPVHGAPQITTFTVTPLSPTEDKAVGIFPNGEKEICFIFVGVTGSSCTFSGTPSQTNAAATLGEVRAQASTVTNIITDRVRGVARGLAEGLEPSGGAPAKPGDTIIMKDFSSNPALQYRYGGLSAGSPDTRWSVWADASGSFIGNNALFSNYSGSSVVGLSGIDYLLDRHSLVGMSAGYTHADLTLSPSALTHTSDGALVGPYGAYVINPNFAIDALFNYTALGYTISSAAPGTSGSYHSDRLTGAADLDVFKNFDAIKLTGYGGYAYSWEGGNASSIIGGPNNVGNNIRYGAVRLGGEAAYDIDAFEPYIPLTFEYETTSPNDGSSRAALIVGGGVRYFVSDTVTAGLLAETTQIKTHTRDVLISAHVRWSF